MSRHNRSASLLAAGLILGLCGGFGPTPAIAQGGSSPPQELKAFFDTINALRSDPAGNSNLLYDLARARDPNYQNQSFFSSDVRDDGKTGLQHFAEFAAWLRGQSPVGKLQWDADLAAYANSVTDQTYLASRKPDVIKQQGILTSERPENVIMWWVFFGGENAIKPLLDPKLKFSGITLRGSNDPSLLESVFVASTLPGRLYTRSDFSGFPFDPQLDLAPPKSTSYYEVKIPEIIPFVKADGTLDAVWRDQGKQPRIRFWRFGVGSRTPSSLEIGAGDAGEYPYLAGFTEDPQGNLYVLRARSEPDLQFKSQPATPPDVETRLYDRPEMFRLTKLDSSGREIWSQNLGKDYGAAFAPFSPMAPRINNGNETNIATSRIAFTTIREPVYTLVADPSVVVPRSIAEKALLGYVTGPKGDKIDWIFEDRFLGTEADGVLTPKTILITNPALDAGLLIHPGREKEKRASFYSDGRPTSLGSYYAFDTNLYRNFLAFVQRTKIAWFSDISLVPGDWLKMRVHYEEVPVIFHLYGCFTDIDGASRHQQAYFRAVRADNGEPVLARNGFAEGHSFQSLALPSREGVITVERSDAGLVIANYMRTAHTRNHRAYIFNHAYNENNSFSELGAIAPTSDGFLVLFTSNHSPNPVQDLGRNVNLVNAEEERSRDLAILRIREGFAEELDRVGTWPFLYSSPTWPSTPGSPPTPSSIFALGGLTSPVYITNLDAERSHSATRPKMVALGDGSFVVFYERWTHQVVTRGDGVKEAGQSYDATVALRIDENGNLLNGPTVLPGGPRLMRGDDAFLYEGKAAWLGGDIVDGKMVLHTIDSGLNYGVAVLPL